jgi:hypothetical protein
MAGGGGQAGEMGGSPLGGSPLGGAPTGGMGGQSTPNMGGGYNPTNTTTTQDMMGRGGNGMSFAQTMGQFGLFGMGDQQGGYNNFGGGYTPMPQQIDSRYSPMPQQMDGGYNPMPQQTDGGYGNFGGYNPMPQQMGRGYGNFGGGYGNFGRRQQSRGQIPRYTSPYMQQQPQPQQQQQQQPQPQQISQLNQLMQGQPMASGGITALRRKG